MRVIHHFLVRPDHVDLLRDRRQAAEVLQEARADIERFRRPFQRTVALRERGDLEQSLKPCPSRLPAT